MAEVHTVPDPKRGGWTNVADGETIDVSHANKSDAVKRGRELAIERKAEHVIHRKDGVISEKNSYGNDPKRSKG